MEYANRVRSIKFFRVRLLHASSVEQVNELLGELRRDQIELRRHIVSILWHMRGGLNYDQAWRLTPDERSDIDHFIQERLKIVERTKLPLL